MSRSGIILVAFLWYVQPTASSGAEIGTGAEPALAGVQFFERKIRPLLISKCYPCHSAAKAEGGLRLDSREALQRGGENGPVVVPGQPGSSPIVQKVRRLHPESDGATKNPVSRVAQADLEAWVKMGAPDPRSTAGQDGRRPAANQNHWAFQPLKNAPVPTVVDRRLVQDPLDAFILARLKEQGIAPQPAADRATLLRRVSFDLTGLPPSAAEVEPFLADTAPGAFERVVDRLLNSARFGERWGGDWLDLVGYADLTGTDVSGVYEHAWRYRDYVIAAFNSDKPYDQFIREQLAGDLVLDSDEAKAQEHLIATGFLLVGLRPVPEPNRAKLALEVADEQVELTSRTFLGLGVACARCHDHKSDPISAREYYGLAGIFTSTSSLGEAAEEGRRGLPRWRECSLASAEELKQVSEFETKFQALKAKLQEAREMKLAFPGEIDSARLDGVVVDNLAAEVHGAWKESNYSTNFVDRNYLHDGDSDKGKKSARFVPDLPKDGLYTVLVSYTPRANRATNVPVTVTCKTGSKTVYVNQTLAPTVDRVFAPVGQFTFAAGTAGSVTISNEKTKGFVVVDAVRFVPVEAGQKSAAPAEADPESALLNYHQIEREVLEFRSKQPMLPLAMAVQEGKIRDCRLRVGGNPDKLGDEVPRGFLSAIGTPDSTLYAITDETSGRLELANWIVNPDNPLAARVAVNRVWLHLFGQGLVETPNDFGVSGAPPSHPELLDHLARRFVAGGWSFKKLIRAIVLSSTYQRRSGLAGNGMEKDPHNRWLGRMDQRPLEPRVLRDASLAATGELDLTAGGPWMPTNNGAFGPVQAARRVQLSSTRRTIYLPVIRDLTPEVVRVVDAAESAVGPVQPPKPASRGSATAVRERLLRERARAWSDALNQGPAQDVAQRVVLAYRQALGRDPTAAESASARELLKKKAATGKNSEATDAMVNQWEELCFRLLSGPEFRILE